MIVFVGGQPKTQLQVHGLGAHSVHYQVLLSLSGCTDHCSTQISVGTEVVLVSTVMTDLSKDRKFYVHAYLFEHLSHLRISGFLESRRGARSQFVSTPHGAKWRSGSVAHESRADFRSLILSPARWSSAPHFVTLFGWRCLWL